MNTFSRISCFSLGSLLLLTSIASAGKLTLNCSHLEDVCEYEGKRVIKMEFVVRTPQEGQFFPTNKQTAEYELKNQEYWSAYLQLYEHEKGGSTYVYALDSDGKPLEDFTVGPDTHLIIDASYDEGKKEIFCKKR